MTPAEFEIFRHQAAHALMDLNEQCENGFRLGDWPRWSCDLERGILEFSRDGAPRVIADVQVAGTTAGGTPGTWRWGWADASLPRRAVERMIEVRSFGEREAVPCLTAGTLPDDEYLGWEMTAVAARVLGARGAFRCPAGDGFRYLVYTSIAFAPPAESATVECAAHGRGFPAYVCEHLAANPAQPWFGEEATLENRWPDAWCAACDAIFLEAGEWNQRTAGRVNIRTLCHRCYEGKRAMARG